MATISGPTSYAWPIDLVALRPGSFLLKRAVDVAGAALLLVVLAPLLVLVALLVRLTSPGPAIFVQRRIGHRCAEFSMLKFRTMRAGADRQQDALAESLRGATFLKVADDPRTTPLGRILRRSSLDELPQLVNVLRGEMSLVGPRPLLVCDFRKFPRDDQMMRFAVRPGITGLWQVSGRSRTSDAQRMRLDREYVERWSLALDLEVLVRTVPVVLSGDGAC